jgi:hypothetical protein
VRGPRCAEDPAASAASSRRPTGFGPLRCGRAWPWRARQRQAPSRLSVRREGLGFWRRSFGIIASSRLFALCRSSTVRDAGISQSPGTCERQSSTLPCLGSAPVLLERGRFGPARQVPPISRFGCGFSAIAPTVRRSHTRDSRATRARSSRYGPFERRQTNLGWNRNCILATETILAYLRRH